MFEIFRSGYFKLNEFVSSLKEIATEVFFFLSNLQMFKIIFFGCNFWCFKMAIMVLALAAHVLKLER